MQKRNTTLYQSIRTINRKGSDLIDGLIIKKKWLDLILSGKKTLEIRSSSTKKTKIPIYLLESGSKRVRGTCIIQSAYPISCSDWSEEQANHCVDLSYKELKERYKNPHAWVLADVKPVEDVWYYNHPSGAVIWVKDVLPIDEMQDGRTSMENIGEYAHQLGEKLK